MRGRLICLAGLLALVLVPALWPAAAQAPSERVRSLLRRMTIEEKLSLVHGTGDPKDLGAAGYWPGLPRLGIPPMRFADGPPGINANREASGVPAPVALAATFDLEAARLFGVVMGRDAVALDLNVVLSPYVNIVRDPRYHRNHTTFSEDPLLAARIGGAQIRGLQSQGVMAEVKHLAGYNGEASVIIDERTLHEIYLPAFEAAVRAGVASVMCGYNRINGEFACENGALQNGILRGELGFKGFVTSDWGAVHSAGAIAQGLDLEMPGREIGGRAGGPAFTSPLKAAVENGTIPVAAVDRAVGRILEQMLRLGWLDRKRAGPGAIDVEADAKVIRGIAAAGAVLLRNENGALPLTPEDLSSLVLIGPTAVQPATGFLGERAYGFESRLVSPLAALRAGAPRARIEYATGVDLTGTPILASAISHDGHPGLLRRRASADIAATQVDTTLDFHGPTALEASADFSWSGTLTVPEEDDYTFLIQPVLGHGSEGSGTVAIDGRRAARTGGPGFGGTGMVMKKWSSILPTTDGRDNGRGPTRHLAAGPHAITLTANSTGEGPLSIRFAWITPQARRAGIDAAVAASRRARTAVVFAWSGSGELDLPEDQDELISAVAAAARKTIVVLNTGGPVLMPWRERVNAILEMWYPGQEGGWATADLLLGRVNPSGRLPVTFPARPEDTPVAARDHPERRQQPAAPATSGASSNPPPVTYSEGLAVGYRWYDQEGLTPLFPFGHGLSYSRFEYSGLKLQRTGAGLQATFTVRNAGRVRGSEVAQLYLGPPEGSAVPMPPRSLAAFERVDLEAGAARTVTLQIGQRALSYWSAERHAWAPVAGAQPVYVGASSRDIRLSGITRRELRGCAADPHCR